MGRCVLAKMKRLIFEKRMVNEHFWNQHIEIVHNSGVAVFYSQMPTLMVTFIFFKIGPDYMLDSLFPGSF